MLLMLGLAAASHADWAETGIASWYGPGFAGRPTASTEIYDPNALTAAHKSLPLGSLVRVHNLDNGRSMIVRINDRGPFVRGRIIDLSRAGAEVLGFKDEGLANVRITVIKRKPRAATTSVASSVRNTLKDIAGGSGATGNAGIAGVDVEDEGDLESGELGYREPADATGSRENEWNSGRTTSTSEGYFIQIGAFESKPNADRSARSAIVLGMPTRIQQDGDLYRVLVGPYPSFSQANVAQRDLEREGIDGFLRASRR